MHFFLESENFDDYYTRLKNAGIPIDMEPYPAGAREAREEGWHLAVFIGPDGE